MSPQDRPWIGCHILTSLDGRIEGPFMSHPASASALSVYRDLQASYEADALVYGSSTARGFAGSKVSCFCSEGVVLEQTFVSPSAHAPYCVALDPVGEIAWQAGTLRRGGRPEAHVIEVLSERASGSYRAYLQDRGVSYFVAGENSIDVRFATQELARLFGIESLLVCGGGVTDASFLSAGLIDELSVVVAPVTSAQVGAASLFDASSFASVSAPVDFTLEYADAHPGGVVHLVYSRPHGE